jgi:GNAT superfamily N-acetyltransferase
VQLSAKPAGTDDVLLWRDAYRREMRCQVIHDSIHGRRGWTQEYVVSAGGVDVGYGSVAIGGPWTGKPALYEFYVVPEHRLHIFDLFRALLDTCGAVAIEVQSNDALATIMLHAFAKNVKSEAILFEDAVTTALRPPGVTFRAATRADDPATPAEQLKWRGVAEIDGQVAATGGILFHYNRPYGDIYMEVAEPFRRRGLGSFLVQELKRVCYEGGHVPAARCNPRNVASRRTLQKAGFVPCGHILAGSVSR